MIVTGDRFRIKLQTEHHVMEALVDTGSTISTILSSALKDYGLTSFAVQLKVIRYGNTSTRITSKKAMLKFSFNDGDTGCAVLYVVPQQNERIILGMDWMEKDDIVLYPKLKTVGKGGRLEEINAMDSLEDDIFKKFPALVEESKLKLLLLLLISTLLIRVMLLLLLLGIVEDLLRNVLLLNGKLK